MNIKFTNGDLLSQDTDAIVNTVNCAGIMGKGIALQFKRKWPDNFRAYEKACKAGKVVTGHMFVHDVGGLHGAKPDFIINFPTKNHWREKSKLSYIEEGLKDLILVIKRLNIKSISIPPLGCGNGGLDWSLVKPLIISAFEGEGYDIDVRLFAPSGAPKSHDLITNTERPKMTIGRAVLIKLLSIYRELDYSLSKIEVQKLCYFAQVAGEGLRLDYQKNQFGPYASKLRHVLDALEGHYIEGVGDNDTSLPQINLKSTALGEANEYLKDYPDSLARVGRVADLIEGFETPYGVELLATVHWVLAQNSQATEDQVVQSVHNWDQSHADWNERKKSLMSSQHISIACARLRSGGWDKLSLF